MAAQTAFSTNTDVSQAVLEISRQLQSEGMKTVVFFASPLYDPVLLAHGMQQAFPKVPTWGCSTAGEIVSGRLLTHSLVAMALPSDLIDNLSIEVVEGLQQGASPVAAAKKLGFYFEKDIARMDHRHYVGVILMDGLSNAEERVMDQLGNLTDIIFIGGSAGDDMRFVVTHVYAQGKAYTNAALLVLLKPRRPFEILKTQSFCALNRKLVATKVDADRRTVLEFNHRPAVTEYASAISADAATVTDQFMHHPVGLMIDGQPYVRSPQRTDQQAIVFFCQVLEGTELALLESTNIVTDTAKALEEKKKAMDGISAILNFHCILRTLELEKKGQTDAYAKLFSDIPTIGFSTYGEAYIGHINQTSTMLLLK
ncbi:MAG: FIST N-terminal domain-containing protein [Elusimicrobiota bacterium]|jgi:hypothetical protein